MKRNEVYSTICGAIIGVVGLIPIFSLISYNPEDISGTVYPHTARIENICGIWGANIAHYLLTLFGFASYLFVFLTCLGAFLLMGALKVEHPLQKVTGCLFFSLSFCGWLSSMTISTELSQWPLASYGGVLGYFYHATFAIKVGPLGETLILALTTFLGLFLTFEDKLINFLSNMWGLTIKGGKLLHPSEMKNLLKIAESNENEEQLVLSTESARRETASLPVLQKSSSLPSISNASIDLEEEPIAVEEENKKPKKRISAEEKEEQKKVEEEQKEEEGRLLAEARRKQAAMAAARAVSTNDKKKPQMSDLGLPDDQPVQAMKGDDRDYHLPSLSLLDKPRKIEKESQSALEERAIMLVETLADFGIPAELVSIVQGPVVTLYEISIGKGIRIQKILSLPDNIAMALRAESVRIIAPLPGKATIGIEIPNNIKEDVRLSQIIESESFDRSKFTLPFLIGRDAAGDPLVSDITRMPHILIAGATGSGKSVCINSLIVSLVMFCRPDELKMVMIDPKMVEMKGYEGLPHLAMPVVVDMKKAAAVLERMVEMMEKRYRILSKVGVRNIASYNALSKEEILKKMRKYDETVSEEDVQLPMPYIVVIVDELADLMMSAPKDIEVSITRLAQKSRAVGIHVVLATQRPSVDVVTGLIKSNMPTRLSFQTASKVDSRTILDQQGAENLLGMGDMLFMPPGSSKLVRAQGVYLSDKEINNVIEHCTEQARPQFDEELVNATPAAEANEDGMLPGEDDELFDQAVRVVLESERGSASLLQRKFSIGYNRASRLIEIMEERGIIGPHKGSVARDIYMTLEEWDSISKGQMLEE